MTRFFSYNEHTSKSFIQNAVRGWTVGKQLFKLKIRGDWLIGMCLIQRTGYHTQVVERNWENVL